MEGALDLAAIRRVAAPAGGIPLAAQLHHAPGGILDHFPAGHETGPAETHLSTRRQAEPLLGGLLAEVVLLDVELPREGQLAGAHGGIVRMVRNLHLEAVGVGHVGDDDLQGPQYRHASGGPLLQVLADAELQQARVGHHVALGHAHLLREGPYGLGRVAPAPQAADGGHAGIVPAPHDAVLHQLEQAALAHHRVGEVQAGELDLTRQRPLEELCFDILFQEPLVEGAVVLELQGADGVRDGLEGVRYAVGVVVHGVEAPGVARAVVVGPADAVHERIAQVHVAAGHVDLRAQDLRAIRELARLHAAEEVQILLGAPVSVRAVLPRHMEVAAVLADLGLGQVADIGLALPDQVLRVVIEEGKVVRRVVLTLPVETEPAHVLADGVHILHILLHGVRVVEAQVGGAAVGLRQAEVQADALGVADVQVAVGLRREAREHPPPVLPRGAVRLHDLLDEVEALGFGRELFRRHWGSRRSNL